MNKLVLVLAAVVCALGCANVKLGGAKEPIKMDITMRLDIYQHVEKDIDAIEGIVSGAKKGAGDQQSWLGAFVGVAYAQEGLGSEVEQAALRRKSRIDELYALEGKGAIGENEFGLVEVLSAVGDATRLVSAENSDRMVIYTAVAAKNSTSIAEVQKLYAKRLRNDAPSGTPVKILNESTGAYEWKVK